MGTFSSGNTSGILKVIRDNKFFIVPFFLLSTYLIILIGIQGSAGLFLNINSYSSTFADHFFYYITDLGDGFVPYILIIVLLFVSFRESLTFLAATSIISILVTLLKRYYFPEFDRPVTYFEFTDVIRHVPAYDPPLLYSFPSGHTATAFSVFLYLSILSKNQYLKFILFCIAALVSFSRVYLSAHFPLDIFFGSYIAVSITILVYYFSRRIEKPWIDRKIEFRPKISIRKQAL
jgi:membrane-associated phospholipid phosphatase